MPIYGRYVTDKMLGKNSVIINFIMYKNIMYKNVEFKNVIFKL
jgi:hypothetical protein